MELVRFCFWNNHSTSTCKYWKPSKTEHDSFDLPEIDTEAATDEWLVFTDGSIKSISKHVRKGINPGGRAFVELQGMCFYGPVPPKGSHQNSCGFEEVDTYGKESQAIVNTRNW